MDGYVTIGTKLDTKTFEEEIKQTEQYLNRLVNSYEKASNMKGNLKPSEEAMANLRLEIEKTNNKLITLKKRQSDLGKTDFSQIKNLINDVGKSIENTTKKISKWALAIIGVRSAYMAVRNATNIIASNDEQLKADIDYMKNALAYTLEPVVRAIVDLMKQMMFYVGYIVKAWTGRDIFENANKSLKNANSQATKLSKTLAGFDEMNVLQDTSSSGGSSAVMPSFDLTKPDDVPMPQWVRDIIDNKNEIIATLAGITGGLIALRVFGLEPIKALGIGLIIAGVIELIETLDDYLKKLDGSLEDNGTEWEDFGGILSGIGSILLGIGILMGPAGVPLLIAGGIALIVGTIMKNWKTVEDWWQKAKDFIYGILTWIQENFGLLGDVIYGVVDSIVDYIEDHFKGMFLPIKQVFDGILLLLQGDVENGIKNIAKGIANHFIGAINKLIDGINMVSSPIRALIVGIGQVLGKNFTMSNIKIPRIPYLAKGGIVNMPGRGVPVGGAFTGERGAEGVIPLTDSQQMAMLGEAIGKYITINANITNTMNGRVISRELQKIQNNSDFAFNR